MESKMNCFPQRLPDDNFNECLRYIYIAKLYPNFRCKSRNDIYKIGYTKDIKNRFELLSWDLRSCIGLQMYGISANHEKAESYLHSLFRKKRHGYSDKDNIFAYRGECFKLNKNDMVELQSHLNNICRSVVILNYPLPSFHTNVNDYDIIDGKMIPMPKLCGCK